MKRHHRVNVIEDEKMDFFSWVCLLQIALALSALWWGALHPILQKLWK